MDKKSGIKKLGIIGYPLVGISANGFFRSLHYVDFLPPIFWILMGLAGSVCLVLKNNLISNKKYSKMFIYGDFIMLSLHLAIMSLIPIDWGLGRNFISLFFLGPYIFYFIDLSFKGVLDQNKVSGDGS